MDSSQSVTPPFFFAAMPCWWTPLGISPAGLRRFQRTPTVLANVAFGGYWFLGAWLSGWERGDVRWKSVDAKMFVIFLCGYVVCLVQSQFVSVYIGMAFSSSKKIYVWLWLWLFKEGIPWPQYCAGACRMDTAWEWSQIVKVYHW